MEAHTCPVCMRGMELNVTVPCGHPLCRECAQRVLSCPICRTRLSHPYTIKVFAGLNKPDEITATIETNHLCTTTQDYKSRYTHADKALEAAIMDGNTFAVARLMADVSAAAADAALIQVIEDDAPRNITIKLLKTIRPKATKAGANNALQLAECLGKEYLAPALRI